MHFPFLRLRLFRSQQTLPLQRMPHRPVQARKRRVSGRFPRDKYVESLFHPRKQRRTQCAQAALHAIAPDGAAQLFPDGKAYLQRLPGDIQQHQLMRTGGASPAAHIFKLSIFLQTVCLLHIRFCTSPGMKMSAPDLPGRTEYGLRLDYTGLDTHSLLRPRARRRASTLRPFLVDIRARKPCTFTR